MSTYPASDQRFKEKNASEKQSSDVPFQPEQNLIYLKWSEKADL